MAVSYTKVSDRGVDGSGNRKRGIYDVAYSAEAYSSGVPVDKTKVGAETEMESVSVMSDNSGDATLVKYDSANEKLRVYDPGTGTEQAGALTLTVRLVVEGY